MIVDNVYTSCACNRSPHCADWGHNGLVCFGSCHAVAIFSPKDNASRRILQTLCSHKARVNSVKWIKKSSKKHETEFISCSCDKTAIVWTENFIRYVPSAILKGHNDSVSVIDGMYIDDVTNKLLVVTGSVDFTVKIWLREGGEKDLICFQTIGCSRSLSLCLRLTYLPQSTNILLLNATDDAKIHLFVSNLKEEFKKVHSLIGHDDWIRALDLMLDRFGNLFIASGSQDAMIRLWKLTCKTKNETKTSPKDVDIQPEEKVFNVYGKDFSITMESVLAGHDGWIYSVCWHVNNGDPSTMKLLSASLDKSIIVWSPDPQTGMWFEQVRVGDMGGNTLGFYGGMFSADGENILGYGFQGAFNLWTHCVDLNIWQPQVTIGGHFEEVVDMQWEPTGKWLISVSKDQTTRLHAPWVHGNNEITWHEIARPQIHGFDMSSTAIISPNKFVSGAEEKIIRVFVAPNNFVENFKRICKVKLNEVECENVPRGASVPALGLSNKAVYEDEELASDRHVKDEFPAAYFVALELNEPPTEEHLLQNTLWPEVQKLYGHGYEIFTLAAHPNGSLIASACKATNSEHAAIILWNTCTWQQHETLISHQLTVTQLAFSPSGKYLLSVSRDRLWSLFEESGNSFKLISKTCNKNGIHARIIWTCAWSADSKYFATGSRDGKLCIWEPTIGEPKNVSVLELKGESITAVAFQPGNQNDKYFLAIGLEIGHIHLYYWCCFSEWQKAQYLDKNHAHHLAVKRLAFHPLIKSHLASCGSDCCVKIHFLEDRL